MVYANVTQKLKKYLYNFVTFIYFILFIYRII